MPIPTTAAVVAKPSVHPRADADLAALFDAGMQSVLAVPARADAVLLHYAPMTDRDRFGTMWREEPLQPSADHQGWFEINLQELQLDDDAYEYEFIVQRAGEETIAA